MVKKVIPFITTIIFIISCSVNNPFRPTDEPHKVENITLKNATLDIGDTLLLIPDIQPDDAADKSLTWTSDDPDYVTVDEDGKITAIRRYGDLSKFATITATASNGVSGSCQVYVIGDPKFELADLKITAGENGQLTLSCITEKGNNIESAEWTILKSDIAEITSSTNTAISSIANINALKDGITNVNVEIRLENDDNTYWANCTLEVIKQAEIESIILDNITLDIGDTYQLIPTISPNEAVDKSLTWTSDAPEYVTVDENGKITAVRRYGDLTKYATITATASNGVSGSCHVYVTGDPTFTVNNIDIFMKESVKLELSCMTTKGNLSSVKWSVSDNTIATLSNDSFSGKTATADITGIEAGTVNVNIEIKLENDDTIYYANCTVKVKPKQAITLKATEGASYKWLINGQETQSLDIELTENAVIQCQITNPGGIYDTGNLITAGSFEFTPDNAIRNEVNKLGDKISYEYMNMNNNGENMQTGSVTTDTDANNVKKLYFANLTAQDGERLLVCDGGNSSSARVWTARNLKLKGGITYQFSCWAANIDLEYDEHGKDSLAKLKFVIENPENNNNTLLEFTVPEELGKWKEYTSTFTPTKDLDWCHIYIVNYTTVNEGNDFAIDNIYFGTVQNTEATEFLETFTVDISTNPPTVTSTMEKL